MDRRRFRFGYEFSAERDPDHVADVVAGGDMMLEMMDATDTDELALAQRSVRGGRLHPVVVRRDQPYFGLAVHPIINADGQGSRSCATGRQDRQVRAARRARRIPTSSD